LCWLKAQLLSVSAATSHGDVEIVFKCDRCVLVRNGEELALRNRDERLYVLSASESGEPISKGNQVDYLLPHRQLGHLNFRYMEELVKKQVARNVSLTVTKPVRCEDCIRAKFALLPFSKNQPSRRSNRLNELIHSDVLGAVQDSVRGKHYFVLFIDDFSHSTRAAFLSRKSEVFAAFKDYKNYVERQVGLPICRFRSDNGGEYSSKEFSEFLQNFGIKKETIVARRLQQNGVS
ncbi:MAG: hypothetical protein RLZZ69_3711, partial [Cyanobacteriota bacterium]